ncbi:MAG TPA: TonB-dependent receptor, partial [Gemmatimonadaceae bacterium]|nr:TonB-dependent receptor [Gemmatimonadaceae bacterium]
MSIRALPSLLVVASLATAPVSAQEGKPDTAATDARTRLSTVSVTAGRGTATVGSASAVVLRVDSLRLAVSAPLDRALREVPFLLVRTNSRGEAELSVRGSDSRQAAVLFDGLPLSIGWDHRSDPSVFPTTGLGPVVVVRGLSSLLQGPNALGGVVDLGLSSYRGEQITRTQVGLRVGGDQVGTRALQGDLSHPTVLGGGQLTLRVGGGYRDVPALALSHRITDAYSAEADRRTNSDVRQRDGFVSVRYQSTGGAWVGASYSGYALARGVMPELHLTAPRFWRYPEQMRSLALLTAGTGRRRTPLGAGDAEFVVGRNASHTSIESFRDARYDAVVGTETGDEGTTTMRLTADHSLGRGELRSAATLSTVDYDEGLNGAAPNVYQQRLWSTAIEVEQRLAGSLRLTGGYALDASTTPRTAGRESLGRLSAWGGRVGVSALAFDRWRLHASVSRRARFAALRELYSGALNRFQPNPTLRPELLVGGEAGATLLSGVWQLQGVVFRHQLRDAIVRTTLPNRRFLRVNRDEMRSSGLELVGGWSRHGVQLSGDALLQRVRIQDPAVSGSARKPENQPDLRLGADAVVPLAGFRLSASLDHAGRQYC